MMARIVSKQSQAMQIESSVIRRFVAAGMEMPKPVAKAMYPARHTGHFGISTSKLPGTSQEASLREDLAQ